MYVLAFLCCTLPGSASPADEETLEALVSALDEWERTVAFTSHFRLTMGKAASVEAAEREELLSEQRLTVNGWFHKMGERYRFAVDFGAPAVPVPTGNLPRGLPRGTNAVTRVSFDEVTNGVLGLVYHPLRGTLGDTATIAQRPPEYAGTPIAGVSSRAFPNALCPLAADIPNVLRLQPVGVRQDAKPDSIEIEDVGTDLVAIVLEKESAAEPIARQWRRVVLWTAHALPVVREITNRLDLRAGKQSESHVRLNDFQDCGSGCMVARRFKNVNVSRRDGHESAVGVMIWESSDLGETPPTAADFVIEVAPDTDVVGLVARPPKGTARRIDLDQLDRADLALPRPLVPVGARGASRLLLLLVVNAAVALALGIWLYRRHHAPPGSSRV